MWNAQIHCYYCTNNSATVDVHGPIEPKCDTRCPGGVSATEPAMNGQCGRTLFRWCKSHNTPEWVLAAERIKNMFWRNKLLIYSTNKNERDRLKENRVLYETFDNHCSLCLIFLWINRLFFPKRIFTLSATRKTLASILSCGTVLPAPCGKEILWQNLVLLMFK